MLQEKWRFVLTIEAADIELWVSNISKQIDFRGNYTSNEAHLIEL